MSSRASVAVVHHPADLTEEAKAGWHSLAVGAGLPYATPEWMLAFHEHFHGPSTLHVVLLRDPGGALLGVGPLYGPPRGARGPRRLRLLGAGVGQRIAPLAVPGAERPLAEAMGAAARAAGAALVPLDAISAGSGWPELLADAWPGRRALVRTERVEAAPAVSVHPDGWDAFLAARSRNFREQVRRRLRAAERRGGTVRRSADAAQVRADLDSLFDLHHRRFAQMGRTSGLTEPHHAAVRSAAEALVEGGGTRLWVVEAEEGVVAAQLHLRAGDRVCYWNGGVSPEWERESLGLVLMAAAVRDAHELGVRTVDLGSGSSPYKARFADHDDPLAWLALVPVGRTLPAAVAAELPRVARAAAVRRAKTLSPERQERLLRVLRR